MWLLEQFFFNLIFDNGISREKKGSLDQRVNLVYLEIVDVLDLKAGLEIVEDLGNK